MLDMMLPESELRPKCDWREVQGETSEAGRGRESSSCAGETAGTVPHLVGGLVGVERRGVGKERDEPVGVTVPGDAAVETVVDITWEDIPSTCVRGFEQLGDCLEVNAVVEQLSVACPEEIDASAVDCVIQGWNSCWQLGLHLVVDVHVWPQSHGPSRIDVVGAWWPGPSAVFVDEFGEASGGLMAVGEIEDFLDVLVTFLVNDGKEGDHGVETGLGGKALGERGSPCRQGHDGEEDGP